MMNNNFTIFTLSAPNPNQNKSGFSTCIASSVSLESLDLNWNKIFQSMHYLQLKNYIIIMVLPNDEKVEERGVSEQVGERTFEGGYRCKIILLSLI